jgi:hypothetical protein
MYLLWKMIISSRVRYGSVIARKELARGQSIRNRVSIGYAGTAQPRQAFVIKLPRGQLHRGLCKQFISCLWRICFFSPEDPAVLRLSILGELILVTWFS